MNKKFLILFIFIISNISMMAKRIISKNSKDYVNQASWLKIRYLREILQKNPKIQYIKLCDKSYFDYPMFAISSHFPNKGHFEDLFVLIIPQGIIQGKHGYIAVETQMIEEFVWDQRYDLFMLDIPNKENKNIQKISGRVAVISQFGYNNYFHWLNEILGRLALLEMNHIEYDWIYVADEMPYAKETLELWGVDSSKIISVKDKSFGIVANELIIPSLVSNTSAGHNHAGSFIHPLAMQYVREKLLKAAEKKYIDTSKFSKKIFISRKDAYASRRILNEDEIFELFEKKGFVRYELATMSVTEQIMLFAQADIVVSEQGSGLTNILFCKSGTKVYEIFQAMVDNCFWWQSYVLGLQYFPCMTIPINADYFAFCKKDMNFYHSAWRNRTIVALEPIQKMIENL